MWNDFKNILLSGKKNKAWRACKLHLRKKRNIRKRTCIYSSVQNKRWKDNQKLKTADYPQGQAKKHRKWRMGMRTRQQEQKEVMLLSLPLIYLWICKIYIYICITLTQRPIVKYYIPKKEKKKKYNQRG